MGDHSEETIANFMSALLLEYHILTWFKISQAKKIFISITTELSQAEVSLPIHIFAVK